MESRGEIMRQEDKFGFKSYNSWDPLKKVLIGSTLPKDFFADFPDKKVADAMTKVNEETREDLDYFAKVLEESYGVQVYRMPEACVLKDRRYNSVAEFIDSNGLFILSNSLSNFISNICFLQIGQNVLNDNHLIMHL